MEIQKSEGLVARGSLRQEALIEIGNDYRLAAPEPLTTMLETCERIKYADIQFLD